jgi:hypothetical protein
VMRNRVLPDFQLFNDDAYSADEQGIMDGTF